MTTRQYQQPIESANYSRYYLEQCNKHYGKHFFDADTLRFFNSRISNEIVVAASNERVLFVTSEKRDWNTPRLYTVRVMDWSNGSVDSVSEFQEYDTLASAKGRLRREIANY